LAKTWPVVDDDRLDELVRHAGVVTGLYGHGRGLAPAGSTGDDCVEGSLRPLPALVSVHGVVAARDGGDLLLRQLGEIVDGRVRRDVSAVGEGVDERALLHALPPRQLEERPQVVDVRMDAAVGDQAE